MAAYCFDLVIFDNDGVLVDSEWHANGILADLLCEAGLPSTRESCIAEYMGSTLRAATGGIFTSMDELPTLLRRM
jgi:beta-phosphoglucomutase-like phosphatase (HAD superfamily)